MTRHLGIIASIWGKNAFAVYIIFNPNMLVGETEQPKQ
jgi:hypothetical protein